MNGERNGNIQTFADMFMSYGGGKKSKNDSLRPVVLVDESVCWLNN